MKSYGKVWKPQERLQVRRRDTDGRRMEEGPAGFAQLEEDDGDDEAVRDS